jgi:hypothetical protein
VQSSSGKRGSWDSGRSDREYSPRSKGRTERGDYKKVNDRINPYDRYIRPSGDRNFDPTEEDYNQKNPLGRRKNASRDEGDEFIPNTENDDYNEQFQRSVGRSKLPYVSRSGRSGYGGRMKRNR